MIAQGSNHYALEPLLSSLATAVIGYPTVVGKRHELTFALARGSTNAWHMCLSRLRRAPTSRWAFPVLPSFEDRGRAVDSTTLACPAPTRGPEAWASLASLQPRPAFGSAYAHTGVARDSSSSGRGRPWSPA
jgi:hypothetical protein